MITRKEAEKRIKLWNGPCSQHRYERPDGFKFMKTTLMYTDCQQLTFMDIINSRDPEIKAKRPGEMHTTTVIVDSFIHTIK